MRPDRNESPRFWARARGWLVGVVVWSGATGALSFAQAQEVPNFPRVYQWETPQEGWLEVSVWGTQVPRSSVPYGRFGLTSTRAKLWSMSLELEYGLTDRLAVAVYGDIDDPTGKAAAFTQVRFEARYRLFERFQRLLNPALYVELYLPRGAYEAPDELEARLILERDLGDVRVALNPSLSKALSGPEVQEHMIVGASAGAYYRRFWVAQPGLEAFWSLGSLAEPAAFSRQYLSLAPSVDFNLGEQVSLHAAVGFGLNDGTDEIMARGYLTYAFATVRPGDQQR